MERPRRSWLDYWRSMNQLTVTFAVGLTNGMIGPSLIDLAEIYSTTPDQVALVFFTKAIGTFIGSCACGFFFKRMNDQVLIMICLAIYGAVTALIPILPDIFYLHVLVFIGGTAFGVSNIGSQVRLLKMWENRSAFAIQLFCTVSDLGSTVASFACGPFLSLRAEGRLVEGSQLHIPYAAFGILFGVVLVSMIAAYRINPSGIETTKEDNHCLNAQAIHTFETRLLVLLFVYVVICVHSKDSISNLTSIYAVDSPGLHFSKFKAAYLTGVLWTASTSGGIISIFATMMLSVKQLLMITHLLSICASGILIFFGYSTPGTWFGVALMGLGQSSADGLVSGLVFQYLPVRHSHVGVVLTATCLGTAGSAFILPQITETEPIYLQYFAGLENILYSMVLAMILWMLRAEQTVHEKKEQQHGTSEPGGVRGKSFCSIRE